MALHTYSTSNAHLRVLSLDDDSGWMDGWVETRGTGGSIQRMMMTMTIFDHELNGGDEWFPTQPRSGAATHIYFCAKCRLRQRKSQRKKMYLGSEYKAKGSLQCAGRHVYPSRVVVFDSVMIIDMQCRLMATNKPFP